MIFEKRNRIKNLKTFLIIFYLISQLIVAQNATITETTQEFKTYPFSDPNPVANIGNIYPYYKFDGYSHIGKIQKWKLVTLENSYIKVFIMPEIGGKIWGAMDKATGKMFIYYNKVIKFRNIAMRGPWTSGGIEINFGLIGHAPTCSTPVNYTLKKNNDGSVSCILGSTDLPSRSNWVVEVRLPKDKAYFETNLLWHNSTGLNQSYYHWLNGAARAANDLKFIFPGHHYISHSGVPYSWEVNNNGRNISFYKNNNFGTYKSYHVLGEYTDFWGGYYYKDNFGFGHWSNYTDKPGKKIWIWGLSRQGMIWEDLLTDTNGQYVEIQSGRLFNQAASQSTKTPFKHREFHPYSTDTWKELWFPVKETRGMKSATPYGILNVTTKTNQLKIYLNPLQNIEDTLIVKADDKPIYKKYLTLKPLTLFTDSLNIKQNKNIKIELGGDKLKYSFADSLNNYLHRPLQSPPNFDWNSLQGLSIKAKEESKQRKYNLAKKSYLQCLEKDSNYIPALTGIAELYYRSMDYDSALSYAKKALAIDTYDGKSNFVYGLINQKIGLKADAKDGFSIAAHSVEYRSSAFTKLAEINAEEQQWEQAIGFAKKAIDYNKYNLSAYHILIISLRKQKKTNLALEKINTLLKINPLSHFARFEKYLIKKDSDLLEQFKQPIQGEFPAETYLELALTYFNVGLFTEALHVLQNSPENPVVLYWKTYLSEKIGKTEESKKFFIKAGKQSPELIFPFRTETATVLNWAKRKSNCWKPKYYLALIYWNKGKTGKTRNLFLECGKKPDYPPFYLTRGKFFEKSNISKSIKDYKHAINLDNSNWRAWLMLSKLYEKTHDYENSLIAVETIYKQKPDDYKISIPYAKALYNSGKYSQCLSVLKNTTALPNEGMRFARTIYNHAHIMLAIKNIQQNKFSDALMHLEKAKLWPENLGSGKPYQPDEILTDYLEWYISEKTNNNNIAGLKEKTDSQLKIKRSNNNPNNVIVALVLLKEGKQKEAIEFINEWANKSSGDFTQWVYALSKKDMKKANSIFEKIKDNPHLKMFFEQPLLNEIKSLSK